MGVDFVAVPGDLSVSAAVEAVRRAQSLQPEALTSVHALDERGRLRGVATAGQAGCRPTPPRYWVGRL